MSETVTPSGSGLVDRVKNILLNPSATWDAIAADTTDIRAIFMGYVVPLAAIGPICSAIGLSLFGVSMIFVTVKMPLLWAVTHSILSFVLTLIMVYVQGLIIDGLAPNFGGEKNKLQAYKAAAYSWTPCWIAGIAGLMPMLGVIGLLAALYGLYLLYLGLPKLMKVPADKSIGYTAVVVIVTFVLFVVVGAVVGSVDRFGMGGLAAATGTPKVAGTVTVPGMGSVDLDKMQKATEQMAAQASAMQNGQVTVKVADGQALLDLMPQSYMGAQRSDTRTDSGGAGAITASTAEATYTVGGGTIHLKISDIGSMGGIGAMAQAMNVNHNETTATGYKKLSTENGRMVSEEYDSSSKSGSYMVMAGTRVSIEADGQGVDMSALKGLVSSIDAGKAQSLAQ